MGNNAPAGFFHRVQDGLSIPGKNWDKVNHLAINLKFNAMIICEISVLIGVQHCWLHQKEKNGHFPQFYLPPASLGLTLQPPSKHAPEGTNKVKREIIHCFDADKNEYSLCDATHIISIYLSAPAYQSNISSLNQYICLRNSSASKTRKKANIKDFLTFPKGHS